MERTKILEGKVAVVTGAGGVLCSMFARTLAESGAKVALLNRTLANAEPHAKALREEGFAAKAYQANVLDKESLERAHEQVLADFGKCDILLNGAGGNQAGDARGCEQVEAAVSSLLELDADTAMSLSPDSLVTMMLLSGMADSTAEYVSYALDRVADVYEDMGSVDVAEVRRAQAEAVADAFQCDLGHVPAELDDMDRELFG